MKKFVEQLTEIKKDIFEKNNVNKPMDELTYEQKTEFRNATHCSVNRRKKRIIIFNSWRSRRWFKF